MKKWAGRLVPERVESGVWGGGGAELARWTGQRLIKSWWDAMNSIQPVSLQPNTQPVSVLTAHARAVLPSIARWQLWRCVAADADPRVCVCYAEDT